MLISQIFVGKFLNKEHHDDDDDDGMRNPLSFIKVTAIIIMEGRKWCEDDL